MSNEATIVAINAERVALGRKAAYEADALLHALIRESRRESCDYYDCSRSIAVRLLSLTSVMMDALDPDPASTPTEELRRDLYGHGPLQME
jgi:hypothetical protein